MQKSKIETFNHYLENNGHKLDLDDIIELTGVEGFEGVEDDPEEESMLQGEPRLGKSTGNAYGGPLPPA